MNKYLEKIALRRIVKELVAGNLSQSAHSLARQGWIKRPSVYAKGMERGNQELARKRNAIIRGPVGKLEILSAQHGGAISRVDKSGRGHAIFDKNILNPGPRKMLGNPNRSQMTVRHELHEVPSIRKQIDKGNVVSQDYMDKGRAETVKMFGERRTSAFLDNYQMNKGVAHGKSERIQPSWDGTPSPEGKTRSFTQTGSHASSTVLARESNDVRTNPFLGKFKDLRNYSGEAQYLKGVTGKTYGKDRFTNKDYKKLDARMDNKANPKIYTEDNPMVSGYAIYHSKS